MEIIRVDHPDALFLMGEIQILDPATIPPEQISQDTQGIHRWSEELVKCPVTFGDPDNPHYHFMKCGDCGIHRFGAHAEQGAYHYFTYQHPNGRQDELVPPCTAELPKKYEIREAKVCCKCNHICNREGVCDYRCNAGTRLVKAVAKRHSHKPHPLSDFVLG